MVVLSCLDILLRALGRPIDGAVELEAYLGAVAVAMALPLAQHARAHAAFTALAHRPGLRKVLEPLGVVVAAGFYWVGAIKCGEYAWGLWQAGERSMILGIPTGAVAGVVGVGLGAAGIVASLQLACSREKGR